jgi:hypothetical protein
VLHFFNRSGRRSAYRRRSFRAETGHRSRGDLNAHIAHTKSVSAQTAVIQEDKGRESVGVPLSLAGESARDGAGVRNNPQSGEHSARASSRLLQF